MTQRARRALGTTVVIITSFLIATAARASEPCLQTRVTESFVSPDGKARGPGLVKVCPYWTISPSLRLSKVSLNGNTLGVWMTRAGEGRFVERSTISLRRLPEGRIALADFYWPDREGRPAAPGLRAANFEPPNPEVVKIAP